jgi:single-stranded-DNA-specific exonuclease
MIEDMHYRLWTEDITQSLTARLLAAKWIQDNVDDFFRPSFSRYWQDPMLLNDIQKALTRIESAITHTEKIMIFGDYDVDGVSSSYIMYVFFKKFLGYDNISIRLPHRLLDWYGIKSYHLDEIKAAGVWLVITVDNGITAIAEAEHARDIGLDMVITDHHKKLDHIPDAIAVVNPQISPDMPFKEICGAAVAFKVIMALAQRLIPDRAKRDEIFHYFIPIVTIATVADCMPLIDENRLIVKYGLEQINTRKNIPESLVNFLDYLKINDPIDTYHIWFLIAPRLNAGGRVMTPYESLYTLLYTGEKQLEYLKNLDALNEKRKKMQDEIVKSAEKQIAHDDQVIIVGGADFHEWVIGIVAWRLADKYNKPTMVYGINAEHGCAVASLRSPAYASIIDMLYNASPLLERYGGHKQAGGLTIKLEHIDAFRVSCQKFALDKRWDIEKAKVHHVDTHLLAHEYTLESLRSVQSMAPFGEGNREPLFLIEKAVVVSADKVGKTKAWHMKLQLTFASGESCSALFRGAGESCGKMIPGSIIDMIGTLQKDDFRGGVYVKGVERVIREKL